MSEGNKYTDEIKKFERTLEKFERGLSDLGADVKDIKNALLGTRFGHEGLVEREKQNRKDIEALKDWKAKINAYAAVIGAIAGAVGGTVITFLIG